MDVPTDTKTLENFMFSFLSESGIKIPPQVLIWFACGCFCFHVALILKFPIEISKTKTNLIFIILGGNVTMIILGTMIVSSKTYDIENISKFHMVCFNILGLILCWGHAPTIFLIDKLDKSVDKTSNVFEEMKKKSKELSYLYVWSLQFLCLNTGLLLFWLVSMKKLYALSYVSLFVSGTISIIMELIFKGYIPSLPDVMFCVWASSVALILSIGFAFVFSFALFIESYYLMSFLPTIYLICRLWTKFPQGKIHNAITYIQELMLLVAIATLLWQI